MPIGDQRFGAGQGPYVVGVVNLSPESTNEDSVVEDAAAALARAHELAARGARIIDLGGQSSHWAARTVPWREERDRLLPAIAALKEASFLVSVDTWDGRVARAAVGEGVDLVNASDGFQSPMMIAAVAEAGLPVVIPFLNGPHPLCNPPVASDDALSVMLPWFERALERAHAAGVREILLDPGLGYAQRGVAQESRDRMQRHVFSQLERLRALGLPLFAAVMRKQSRTSTLELVRTMVAGGVDFLRAHEPELVFDAMRRGASPSRASASLRDA